MILLVTQIIYSIFNQFSTFTNKDKNKEIRIKHFYFINIFFLFDDTTSGNTTLF